MNHRVPAAWRLVTGCCPKIQRTTGCLEDGTPQLFGFDGPRKSLSANGYEGSEAPTGYIGVTFSL